METSETNPEEEGLTDVLDTEGLPPELRAKKPQLSIELKEEIRNARRCFSSMERLTSLMMSYPPGHPIVDGAAQIAAGQFREFFELNDRLSVMVYSHSFKLLGTQEEVWDTDDPRDYCWALSRDGVYLIHFLAGIDGPEIRRFVDLLNDLIDERDLTKDAVTAMFEAEFRYISYDAIDESMAQIADIELDIRDRDTKEEQEAIEELFDQCFDKEAQEKLTPEQAARKHQEEFQVRMQKRAERQERMKVGSREFLGLSEEQRNHLIELLRGFREHAELEHREGEILAAILGAQPKPKLRETSIQQISEVMGTLLETNAPWESLEFLKLIHHWRDSFDKETTELLKTVVTDCFTTRRLQVMTKMINTDDPLVRRSILQMFNALHLSEATMELALMLAWDLDEEVQEDVVRYLKERSRYGIGFIKEALQQIPPESAPPLLEIARVHLPKSRPIFLDILRNPMEPELKAIAVAALAGNISPEEAKRYLSPLIRAQSERVRLTAMRGLADAAPNFVAATLAPLFNTKHLLQKHEDEIREMTNIFVQYGGASAVTKIKELIWVKGMLVSDAERDLAILLATTLARRATPQITHVLHEIGKDWRTHSKVKTTCRELAEILAK